MSISAPIASRISSAISTARERRVGHRHRIVEDHHHAVAGEALQRAAVLDDDLADRRVVLAQQRHHVFRVRGLGEPGEAAQVAEQRRDLAAMAFELLLRSRTRRSGRRPAAAGSGAAGPCARFRRPGRRRAARVCWFKVRSSCDCASSWLACWRSSLSRRVFSMAMTAWLAKCLQHCDLLVGERPGHKPHDAEQADRLIAAHHGHDRDRAVAAGQEVLAPGGKFRRGIRHVGNIHDPAIKQGCAVHVIPREGGTGNCASPRFDASRIRRGDGRGVDRVPVPERDADEGARKELQPALHDGVEHRLRVAERVADDLRISDGRRLLLQRLAEIVGALAQLVEQARVLDRDDGLRGEGS